jgi:hypothetical protein
VNICFDEGIQVSVSDLMKKVPLINSSNKIVKIAGCILYAFVFLIILGAILPSQDKTGVQQVSVPATSTPSAAQPKDTSIPLESSATHTMKFLSVDVGGWNFTANLTDQWRSNPNSPSSDDMSGANSENVTYLMEHNEYTPGMTATLNWKGVTLFDSFYLPKEGVTIDSQKIPAMNYGKKDNDIIASVDISVHKIPNEVLSWTTHDILYDALSYAPLGTETVKDVKFKGHFALLEEDYVKQDVAINGPPTMLAGYTFDTLEILMPDNTVSTIFVATEPDSGISVLDVINAITFKQQ